jgi:hypothetical protein
VAVLAVDAPVASFVAARGGLARAERLSERQQGGPLSVGRVAIGRRRSSF